MSDTEPCDPPTQEDQMHFGMMGQLKPELSTEQRLEYVCGMMHVFETDQSILLRGMRVLLAERSEGAELELYIRSRGEEIRRLRKLAGYLDESEEEKTDPGMNG